MASCGAGPYLALRGQRLRRAQRSGIRGDASKSVRNLEGQFGNSVLGDTMKMYKCKNKQALTTNLKHRKEKIMNKTNELCIQIDRAIANTRTALESGSFSDGFVRLAGLADLIERHRYEYCQQLEGLRGECEEWKLKASQMSITNASLEQEIRQARADIETQAIRVRDLEGRGMCAAHLDQIQDLKGQLQTMTISRDDWKRDTNECDDRCQRAEGISLSLKNENDSLKARLEEALKYQEHLRDAYDRQKQLTASACESCREIDGKYQLALGQIARHNAERASTAPQSAEVGEALKIARCIWPNCNIKSSDRP